MHALEHGRSDLRAPENVPDPVANVLLDWGFSGVNHQISLLNLMLCEFSSREEFNGSIR
jgi:hypothetical protein